MDWSKYFDLLHLQTKMKETFEVNLISFAQFHLHHFFQMNLRDHIKRTETICNYLQSIEKLQNELQSKVTALEEITSKKVDQNRFLEIVQVRHSIILNTHSSLSFI